ncbi:ankyrin repeat domain-containing protein [Sulfuricurvum sp.]|uniref:ankyrin repeat domain-containing protein n=1 Tax=Sulfuricurvum sp. TaxID=2025608 RepID=UPI003C4E786E
MKTAMRLSLLLGGILFLTGCTTLHTAAAKGNIDAIHRLSGEGNDMNAINEEGITPLIRAVNLNQKQSVIALLEDGADSNAADTTAGNTPLHHAILQGSTQLIRILLERNAQLSIPNKEGKTPLDLARNATNKEILRMMSETAPQKEAATLKVEEKTIDVPQPQLSSLQLSPAEGKKTDPALAVAAKENGIKNLPFKSADNALSTDTSAMLKQMISRYETQGIRAYLNEHPHALALIDDPKQQLRYVGPKGWRVLDIIEKRKKEHLSEKEIILHITKAALPYKKFSNEEIKTLVSYGISYKIINAMIGVTN